MFKDHTLGLHDVCVHVLPTTNRWLSPPTRRPTSSRGDSRDDGKCIHTSSRREVSAPTGLGCAGLLAEVTLARGCRAPPSSASIWLLERCKRRTAGGRVMRQRPPNLGWAPRANCSEHGRRAPRIREGCRDMDPSERGANSLSTDPSELSTKPRWSSESRLTVALWPALAVRGVSCT